MIIHVAAKISDIGQTYNGRFTKDTDSCKCPFIWVLSYYYNT